MSGESPEEAQLPQGWALAKVRDLIELAPKANHPDNLDVGFVPMPSMGTRYREALRFETRKWRDVKKGYTHFEDGDVLLAKITPCFENGKGGVASGLPNGTGAGSTEYFVCRPEESRLLPEVLHAFFKTPKFMADGATQMTGSVGHKRVPKDFLLDSLLPLAPLAEQKRIADKLEAVLGRVDACRARLDRVPALLKRFRQSVLAAAASGKLTEEWRATGSSYSESFVEYPYSHAVVGAAGWQLTTFGDLCSLIGGSQPPKSTFTHDESPSVIRLIQIRDYKSDRHKVFIPRNLARRFCSVDDVMIGRYGPPIFQILRGIEGAYNVALMKAEPQSAKLDQNYVYYWLQQDVLLRYVEAGSDRTAGQDGVRKELVERYPFFLPPVQEQQEIVRRVEALFAFADRIEARLATARKTVERLTPATLAKAFRGELVPQDPLEEPARSLLAKVDEDVLAKGSAKGKRRAQLFDT